MKLYAKLKVMKMTEEQYKNFGKKDVPMVYAICQIEDSFVTLSVWGSEKIQLCKEALLSGVEKDCVLSITGKQYEKDDGTTSYFNAFSIKNFL